MTYGTPLSCPLRVTIAGLASVLVLAAAQTHAAPPPHDFPRLAGYQIGKTPYDGFLDPEYLDRMARLDLVILGGSAGTDVAEKIKARNPDALVGKYTILVDVSQTRPGYQQEQREKIASEVGPNTSNGHDWWARDAQGNQVSTWPKTWTPNHTEYVAPDSNGDRWPEWKAKLDYSRWLKDPVWDFWFSDAVFWRPRNPLEGGDADWSGGKVSGRSEIQAAYRRGHVRHWNQIRKLTPEKLIVVNHDWYRSEEQLGGWKLQEYDQQVEGGLLERIMEDTADRPWDRIMTYYRRSMTYMRDPKLMVVVVQGDPTNYKFFRYSFATCLMDDGYFDYAPHRYHYGTVEWFDEFDVAGTRGSDWLGQPISLPPAKPWQNGVWRRDFEGGVALVNPAGNGTRSIELEDGLSRIDGSQDPEVNNGTAAKTATIADGDGLILVRRKAAPASPTSRPKAPAISIDTS